MYLCPPSFEVSDTWLSKLSTQEKYRWKRRVILKFIYCFHSSLWKSFVPQPLQLFSLRPIPRMQTIFNFHIKQMFCKFWKWDLKCFLCDVKLGFGKTCGFKQYSCFKVTSKWEREGRKTLGRTSYRLENMYLKELTLLNQKFPQDLSHHEIFIAATASKYMFPQIDDLPLSVSIVTPNKFQIYPNLFPST